MLPLEIFLIMTHGVYTIFVTFSIDFCQNSSLSSPFLFLGYSIPGLPSTFIRFYAVLPLWIFEYGFEKFTAYVLYFLGPPVPGSPKASIKFYAELPVGIFGVATQEFTSFFVNTFYFTNFIIATRIVLPLSNKDLPARFGLRHRAAIGITEKTDALCLVVSEETGKISYIKDGEFVLYKHSSELIETIRYDLN